MLFIAICLNGTWHVNQLAKLLLLYYLRQMDALLSPSSRSYYACIGESTHAFQSPSKDLDDINCRLNRFSFISFKKQIFSKNYNLLEAILLTFVFSYFFAFQNFQYWKETNNRQNQF